MSRVALGVCLLLLGGVAASYPAWSQIMGNLSSSMSQAQVSSSTTSTNSTSQSVSANTTEPDVFSMEDIPPAQTTTSGVPFGQDWVYQFIGVVNTYRNGESLTECATLDSFAMTRFDTMTSGTNWEVTHFGYAQDQANAFGGSPGIYAEEYFYPTEPDLRTPQDFASVVMTTAPAHWSDLIGASFKYYGAYYQGQGPILLFDASCGPLEMGAGINQTSAFGGCPYQEVTGPWLVIELSSVCPSS